MEVDASITIGLDDSDIVEAVKPKLETLVWRLIKDEIGDVNSAIESWMDNTSVEDYIDWDSAARSGQMTFEHTDDEVRSLIREVIELNPDVLRPIIAAQVDAAVLYRVQEIVRKEITKWGQSFGNVLANMTHDNKGEHQ